MGSRNTSSEKPQAGPKEAWAQILRSRSQGFALFKRSINVMGCTEEA